jgi:hypothetical protein
LHLSISYEYQQFFQHRICFSMQPPDYSDPWPTFHILVTNHVLSKAKIIYNPDCTFYHTESETVQHHMWNCNFVKTHHFFLPSQCSCTFSDYIIHTTIIDISPRIFSLMHGCCVSINNYCLQWILNTHFV